MQRHSIGLTVVLMLVASGELVPTARGQDTPRNVKSPAADSQAAERRKILESDRWQQANREFDEWLSVQQVYRPEQVETIKTEMREKVAHMSPRELQSFLEDMEARLKVLLSPEAKDARVWLKQFLAVARNPEQQLGRERPDVLNMTASQIRQEIQWLEQHRASRQQAQAAFDTARSLQSQSAQNVQAARQAARAPVPDRSSWPANTPQPRSQYSPRREILPMPPSPVYMIGPWGAPYFRF